MHGFAVNVKEGLTVNNSEDPHPNFPLPLPHLAKQNIQTKFFQKNRLSQF